MRALLFRSRFTHILLWKGDDYHEKIYLRGVC